MGLVQQEEAEKLIQDIKPILYTAFENALETFNLLELQFNGPVMKRTKTAVFYNLLFNELKNLLPEDENRSHFEKYESLRILIKGRLAARFKKFNSSNQASNIPTKRNLNMLDQMPEFEFEELPSITHIDIGYIIDDTWTSFKSIRVVCRKGKSQLWCFDIDPVAVPILEEETYLQPLVELPTNSRFAFKNKEIIADAEGQS